jgi:HTH-type transcriptional regulator/antitoxin HipB
LTIIGRSQYGDIRMEIRSVPHLGQVVRRRRLELDLSQAAVAASAGVSRQWMVAFEAGKPTVELASALQVLRVLHLAVDVRPASASTGGIDLDRLLDG